MRVDKWLNVPATLEEFERGFESRPFTETVTICFDSGMRIPSIEEFSTLWMLAADLFRFHVHASQTGKPFAIIPHPCPEYSDNTSRAQMIEKRVTELFVSF